MKKITLKSTLLTGASILALTAHAQNPGKLPTHQGMEPEQPATSTLGMNPAGPVSIPQAKSAAVSTCTDMINSSGNTAFLYTTIGFKNPKYGNIWDMAVFQVYPAYTGEVLGAEFTASKAGINNPDVYVAVFDLLNGAPNLSTQKPVTAPFVTVNSSNIQQYTRMFAQPVQVTNGFAVGVFCINKDSASIYAGQALPSQAPYYSYIHNSANNLFSFMNYFNVDCDLLIKPIVRTSAQASWVASKTSAGCTIPAVHSFTDTSTPWPSYINNPVINPSGVSLSVNYGDGTPATTTFPSGLLSHPYAVGTYTATYTRKYTGWVNNCETTENTVVNVDNPLPAFTYDTDGLTVKFTNTSQGMSNFSWNFGDLNTSSQTSPTYTFSSPGTYVVELEATAPCGTVKFSQTITVAIGVGIKESSSAERLVRLFPNPATDVISISNVAKDEMSTQVEIFNSMGTVVRVLTLSKPEATIDISGLSKGVYFVRLRQERGDTVRSFVKE